MVPDENGKFRKRAPRYPDNNFIEIKDEVKNKKIRLLTINRSDQGFCCIHGGETPLSDKQNYTWDDSELTYNIEVCWFTNIEGNIFKSGMKFV